MKLEDFRRLPKIDLHHHLDGAIRVGTILELARRFRVPLPARTASGLAPHVQVRSRCRTLAGFLRKFNAFYPILPHAETLERIAYEACEDQARDGVVYFETRFAPVLCAGPGFTMEDAVRAALRGLRRGGKDFGVRWGLILCCYRGFAEASKATIALAEKLGCAGVDLAGDERRYPLAPHAAALRRTHLPLTIHAGEAGPGRNVVEALRAGARRIGHGVHLGGGALEAVRRAGATLEMCLTSNLHTGTVRSLRDHPFPRYYRAGLRVTLNTDDPGVSGITLSGEFLRAHRAFGLREEDFLKIVRFAQDAAFVKK